MKVPPLFKRQNLSYKNAVLPLFKRREKDCNILELRLLFSGNHVKWLEKPYSENSNQKTIWIRKTTRKACFI